MELVEMVVQDKLHSSSHAVIFTQKQTPKICEHTCVS